MGLLSDLGNGPVALDTSIFIYFIEEHPVYLPLVEPLFEAMDRGELEAVTSSLTLLEDAHALRRPKRYLVRERSKSKEVPIDVYVLEK